MRRLCRRARLHYCDLLGHPIESISRVAGVEARREPGARAPLDQTYFKRVEAIEFAVKYDDGFGSGLEEAEIVLVGVSRTSKTPLSMYLGSLGHKTANVPIVKSIEPPEALFEIDRARIVGSDDRRGAARRDPAAARLARWGRHDAAYAGLQAIYEELDKAAAIHRRLGCPVIDVTEISVEETAMRIIKIVDRRLATVASDR